LNNKSKIERVIRPGRTCKDEVALIADYLSRRLDAAILAAFEKHLNDCPDCTAFLNTYKKTIEATKAFLRIDSFKIWPTALKHRPNNSRLLVTLIFWVHLFVSHLYLTTG
jgi:Putative zinc-finger